MPEVCEICGRRLWRARAGNAGSCIICPISICRRCEKYFFCPTHFADLSAPDQQLVKRTWNISLLAVPITVIFALVFSITPYYYLQDTLPHTAWLWKIWRRNKDVSPSSALPPKMMDTQVWYCKFCGVPNSLRLLDCGKCGKCKLDLTPQTPKIEKEEMK